MMLFFAGNVDQVLKIMFTEQMSKTLIYVAGPTGIGKSDFSISIAKDINRPIIKYSIYNDSDYSAKNIKYFNNTTNKSWFCG